MGIRRPWTPWSAFLLAGTSAALLIQLTPERWRQTLTCVVQVAGIVAMIVGVRGRRPPGGRAWWVLVLSLAVWTAPVVLGVATAAPRLVSYALFAAGLWLLGKGPGDRAGSMIDATIITGGGSVLVWTFVVRPLVEVPGPGLLSLATAFTVAVLDLLIFAAMLRLVLFGGSGRRPQPAALLLALSTVALVVADNARYVTGVTGVPGTGVPAIGWPLWAVLAGAAALHPGGRRPRPAPAPPAAPEALISRQRLMTFVVLAVLVPAVPIAFAAVAGRPEPSGPNAYLVPAVIAALVCVLLVVRLSLVVQVADRRAHALRREAGEREALERELRHGATHDPLTGLANRALLVETLDELVAGHGYDGRGPLSVLLLDLDGFKDVNDTLGHPAGDEVLVQVADRLRAALPTAVMLARLGGDEFAMVYRESAARAHHAAHRALDCLRAPYRVAGREVHLTGSVGLLVVDGQAGSADVLRDADLALYAAKDAGKNQVALFADALRDDRVRQSDLVAGLRRALVEDELTLHYQPVVRLRDRRMVAVEALLRWTPPDAPVVPPTHFIPVAEQTGLIVPIGWWALRRACLDARSWYAERGIAVTVNVSGYQLRDPYFATGVVDLLAETGLPAAALVLELTESVLITHADAVAGLDKLRAIGVRVAIDDFGTGYSSLSYLVQLPVDILKIDRAFTVPSGQAAASAYAAGTWAFTRAILDLAGSLRLETIAEGVETEEQAASLRALSCPLGQGYLFSRPVPAAEIDALLAELVSSR